MGWKDQILGQNSWILGCKVRIWDRMPRFADGKARFWERKGRILG